MELGREQHQARIRAPPKDGLALAVPREDAAPVGGQQPLRGQFAAGCEQAGRVVQCGGNRREGGRAAQPGDHAALQPCSAFKGWAWAAMSAFLWKVTTCSASSRMPMCSPM